MTISGIGSAGGFQNQAPSVDTQSIEQKIQKLQGQLKKVKEDESLPPEEQIRRLEEQKRKAEQKEQQKEGAPGEEAEKKSSRMSLDDAVGNYVDEWG